MTTLTQRLPLLLIVQLFLTASARADDFSAAGPHRVDVVMEPWTDANRDGRVVPVKIYYPSDLTAPAPAVIVSHGLGGSRDGYAYLGRHLASHGYVCVHLTHAGSDTEALRDAVHDASREADKVPDHHAIQSALKKIAANPTNALVRPRDISFAIDRLLELNAKDGPLKAKIDPKKIGVMGHSFGAYTAMAVAGQSFGPAIHFRDERVRAAVVMSPPVRQIKPEQYEPITIPLLLMTGTLDDSPVGGAGANERRKVFDLLVHSDRCLLIFDGGDHMVFSGRPPGMEFTKLPGTIGDASKDAHFQQFVKASTLRFFDAWLKDDEAAKLWLSNDDGAKALLGTDGTWKCEKGRK